MEKGGIMTWGSAPSIARVFTLLALVHSLLASRPAKELARRLLGARYRNGLYRLAYMIQSTVSTVGFALWFPRLPDRELYRVRAPYSWPLRAVQVVSAGLFLAAIHAIGVACSSGLASFAQLLAGRDPEPEPEAQGPALGPDGELRASGPFRLLRHPDTLPVAGLLWCFPRMTVNRATLAALATLYAVVGSLHEDHRLRAAYGAAYERYRRRVPFF